MYNTKGLVFNGGFFSVVTSYIINLRVSCNGKRNTLMTKRSQIILIITAIIFFVIAFTLDITSFGQEHKHLLEKY